MQYFSHREDSQMMLLEQKNIVAHASAALTKWMYRMKAGEEEEHLPLLIDSTRRMHCTSFLNDSLFFSIVCV